MSELARPSDLKAALSDEPGIHILPVSAIVRTDVYVCRVAKDAMYSDPFGLQGKRTQQPQAPAVARVGHKCIGNDSNVNDINMASWLPRREEQMV